MSHVIALLAAGTPVLVALVHRYFTGKRRLPLPPGPKGWPLIGNMLDMPANSEWITYHKWAKDLESDIIHINCAGTDIIVLDTREVAVDLLEKRSTIYSGRARMPMVVELMGWDFAVGFSDYGNKWRHRRRIMSEQLNVNAIQQFHPQLTVAIHGLLLSILKDPHLLMNNIKHLAADTIFSLVYGLDVEEEGKAPLAVADEANQAMFNAAVPGRFLVDFIPALAYVPEWVPGAKFQNFARHSKKLTLDMIDIPYVAARAKSDVTSQRTLVSRSIAKMKEGGSSVIFTDENIKAAAGSIYTAGSDTTVSCLATCILALVSHPHVVKKAQQALDNVLAPGQLPSFQDEESLPYITAIVKEALRWHDVVPMGIPHKVGVEDNYRGYRIPKGSIVMANSWAMLHDPEIYPDPFTFNPDRFIKDGKIDTSVPDPELSCFGFGRRICPGRHMAYSTVWLAVASILTAFDIGKEVDNEGNVVEPGEVYHSALVCTPLPFPYSIAPRSTKWADTLRGQVGSEKD